MTDPRYPRYARTRLAAFLVLSAALHASVLLGGRNPAWTLDAGDDREVLSVSLQEAITPKRERPRPPRAVEPPATSPTDSGATPVPAASRSLQAANGDDDGADTANRVRAQVVSELARHFRYPPLARLRGWQGRVLLGVRVESDGQLQHQRVLHTSGFAVLDQAALNSLRRVERVADTGNTRLDLQISVFYHLTDTN